MSITATRFFGRSGVHPPLAVEDRFFTDLRTRNSTFKRTASDRFYELDEVCVRHFADADACIEQVLDIGVSSGTTTLALSDRLRVAGYETQVIGTDVSLDGRLVPALPGVRVLTDGEGHPLQYDVLGKVLRPWGRRADYVTGMLVVRAAANAWFGRLAQRQLQNDNKAVTKVQLISPRIAEHSNVSIEHNDIFVDTPAFHGRFNFIRAANILNRGYFDEATLRKGMANIVRYLSGPRSWLLIARSTQGRHVGTLFRVSADGRYLDAVDRFGGGSEVEWLALETDLATLRK